MATTFVVGVSGVVLVPAAAYAWVIALGIASGGMFALVMTLPLDLEHEPGRVGALVGMMLGLGYTIGAMSPFVLGAVRDADRKLHGLSLAPRWFLRALGRLRRGATEANRRSRSSRVRCACRVIVKRDAIK